MALNGFKTNAEIFGDPAEKKNFVIGSTREQGHPVCIDLGKFVQRSAGVFGATGTGCRAAGN